VATLNWQPAAGLSTVVGPLVSAKPSLTTSYYVTGTDANGCTATSRVVVVVNKCAGINELLSNSLQLYPNPTNDNLTVLFTVSKESNVVVRLTDMKGREIYSQSVNQPRGEYRSNIDLSEQPKGVYMISVMSDEGVTTRKVILE
jgi:hypothetical protein